MRNGKKVVAGTSRIPDTETKDQHAVVEKVDIVEELESSEERKSKVSAAATSLAAGTETENPNPVTEKENTDDGLERWEDDAGEREDQDSDMERKGKEVEAAKSGGAGEETEDQAPAPEKENTDDDLQRLENDVVKHRDRRADRKRNGKQVAGTSRIAEQEARCRGAVTPRPNPKKKWTRFEDYSAMPGDQAHAGSNTRDQATVSRNSNGKENMTYDEYVVCLKDQVSNATPPADICLRQKMGSFQASSQTNDGRQTVRAPAEEVDPRNIEGQRLASDSRRDSDTNPEKAVIPKNVVYEFDFEVSQTFMTFIVDTSVEITAKDLRLAEIFRKSFLVMAEELDRDTVGKYQYVHLRTEYKPTRLYFSFPDINRRILANITTMSVEPCQFIDAAIDLARTPGNIIPILTEDKKRAMFEIDGKLVPPTVFIITWSGCQRKMRISLYTPSHPPVVTASGKNTASILHGI